MNLLTKDIIGGLLIFTSILDAIKYTLQANKIRKIKSSKVQSRKFINFAITNDVVKLIYGTVIMDLFIVISSLLAIGCMLDLWYTTYLFYPYRMKIYQTKKPNIFIYLVNSIQPNHIRRHL